MLGRPPLHHPSPSPRPPASSSTKSSDLLHLHRHLRSLFSSDHPPTSSDLLSVSLISSDLRSHPPTPSDLLSVSLISSDLPRRPTSVSFSFPLPIISFDLSVVSDKPSSPLSLCHLLRSPRRLIYPSVCFSFTFTPKAIIFPSFTSSRPQICPLPSLLLDQVRRCRSRLDKAAVRSRKVRDEQGNVRSKVIVAMFSGWWWLRCSVASRLSYTFKVAARLWRAQRITGLVAQLYHSS